MQEAATSEASPPLDEPSPPSEDDSDSEMIEPIEADEEEWLPEEKVSTRSLSHCAV